MLVECTTCEAFVDGEYIADYVHYEAESDMTGKYIFLKCPRCSRPFIMLQVDDGTGIDSGWSEPSRLYPPIEMGIGTAIPNPLRLAYDEARSCFRAKAYTAT